MWRPRWLFSLQRNNYYKKLTSCGAVSAPRSSEMAEQSMTQHYTMLARNLLYTGVTRGKKLVVLVGQRKALAIAVRNGGQRRRWSKLREWLTIVKADKTSC